MKAFSEFLANTNVTFTGILTFIISLGAILGKFVVYPSGLETQLVQLTSFVLGAHVLGKAYNLKKP